MESHQTLINKNNMCSFNLRSAECSENRAIIEMVLYSVLTGFLFGELKLMGTKLGSFFGIIRDFATHVSIGLP